MQKVLFGVPRFTAELSWTDLARELPGWEISVCPRDAMADHVAWVDVICPWGAPVDAVTLKAGTFGLVQQFGVGLESVDVQAATDLGVWVARIPGDAGGNADSVAELALLQMLAITRRLDEAREALWNRRWEQRPLGGTLLGSADVVVCCAMLHEGNARMFGEQAFAAMKPGAIFVNVARGGLVDENALLAALESGQVSGAGLDVHAREPADPESALLRHPRVFATPHVGGLTRTMFTRTGRVFAGCLERWAAGEVPRWAVNSPAFCRAPGKPPGR